MSLERYLHPTVFRLMSTHSLEQRMAFVATLVTPEKKPTVENCIEIHLSFHFRCCIRRR